MLHGAPVVCRIRCLMAAGKQNLVHGWLYKQHNILWVAIWESKQTGHEKQLLCRHSCIHRHAAAVPAHISLQ